MKSIRLKIAAILLMLVPVPFSCDDKNECLDLYVDPYFDIQDMDFIQVNSYFATKNGSLEFSPVSQDYDSLVYACDSLAMYFMTPDTSLIYHSQHIRNTGFGFTQEAFACNPDRPGYAGTRELVDKIYVSSNADFDERHGANYDLSDIIRIFAYTTNGKNSWVNLNEYNNNSPYEAPKRFYLMFTQKPTKEKTHQFTIKYYMKTGQDEAAETYFVKTPVLHLR